MKTRYLLIFVLIGLIAGVATAAALTVTISPGDQLLVSCLNALTGQSVATGQYSVSCEPNTPTSTPSPVPPTATALPSATATATSAPPTETAVPPSPTPASSLPAVDPVILGTCPASVHDRYTTVGPNARVYRTWHPTHVLIDAANPGAGYCDFAHEHGMDPHTSLANSSLPAFGYIGEAVNDSEPHEGFKVAVVNQGTVNDEQGVAQTSTRMVFHMGTGGPKRFDTQFHSLQFDLTDSSGHFVHVYGMADTGQAASICANPRQARTVVVTTSCTISSLYEIWGGLLSVGKATINFEFAQFDPITVLDPNSLPGQRPLIYTVNALPQFGGPKLGCNRETYSGPLYFYNGNGPTTFTTNAYGGAGNVFTQSVSLTNAPLGIAMSSKNFYQMKLHASQCVPGLGLKN